MGKAKKRLFEPARGRYDDSLLRGAEAGPKGSGAATVRTHMTMTRITGPAAEAGSHRWVRALFRAKDTEALPR